MMATVASHIYQYTDYPDPAVVDLANSVNPRSYLESEESRLVSVAIMMARQTIQRYLEEQRRLASGYYEAKEAERLKNVALYYRIIRYMTGFAKYRAAKNYAASDLRKQRLMAIGVRNIEIEKDVVWFQVPFSLHFYSVPAKPVYQDYPSTANYLYEAK